MILVTGAAGFIGQHLARYLCQKYPEQRFLLVDMKAQIQTFQNGWVVVADLTQSPVEIEGLTLIVHLAAMTFVDESFTKAGEYIYNNVMSTQQVVEMAQRYNARLLHVSTDEVLGTSTEQTYTGQYAPTNPYSASKAAAEMVVISSGLQYAIIRSNNVYGPGQSVQFNLIPKSIDRLSRGLNIELHGDGQSRRRYIYVQDYVQAIDQIIQSRPFDGYIYNVASDDEFSNWEVALLILTKMKLPTDRIEFVQDRKTQDKSYYLPHSILQQSISFDKGLDKIINS